jgi:hypothetical protein
MNMFRIRLLLAYLKAMLISLFRPPAEFLSRYMRRAGMVLDANPGPAATNTYSPQMPTGNVSRMWSFPLTLIPPAVAAASIGAQAFSNTGLGLQVGDTVQVSFQAAQTAGVSISDAYVSAADQLTIRFVNPTAGSVTPAAGIYQVLGFRPIPASQQSLSTPAISW